MHAKNLAAAAISAGLLSLGGWATPASAVPMAPCDHYPPVHCGVSFDQSSYDRGETANFSTDKAFFRHELVDGKVKCRRHHFHKNVGTYRAHHHRVIGDFTVPRHAPHAHCRLILTGERSGNKATGGFDVN